LDTAERVLVNAFELAFTDRGKLGVVLMTTLFGAALMTGGRMTLEPLIAWRPGNWFVRGSCFGTTRSQVFGPTFQSLGHGDNADAETAMRPNRLTRAIHARVAGPELRKAQ
jgi:hypothetical protein